MNTVLDQPAVPGGDAVSDEDRSCDEEPPSRLSLALERVDDDGDWARVGPVDDMIAAVAQVLAVAPELSDVYPATAAVALSSDDAVRRLNAAYRGKDKPTNVLSLPAARLLVGRLGPLLGDIVLASETVEREAEAQGVVANDHLTHLIVHGFLHLIGHDHEDDSEALVMEGLETAILGDLGIADPYAA
jgi:probable rRNA maturation factor